MHVCIYVCTYMTPHLKKLTGMLHFQSQKFDVFFWFLFPVSDHPAWSRMIVNKPLLNGHKIQFSSLLTDYIYQVSREIQLLG